MGAHEVAINYDIVGQMASGFDTASQVLNVVTQVLRGIAAALMATAFIGGIGAAAAAYVNNIANNTAKVGETCGELSKDIRAAMEAIRNGDESGTARFA